MPLSLVTGASRGLGLAVAEVLVGAGHHVVVDARDGDALRRAVRPLGAAVTVVAGDVTDAGHRAALADVVAERGGVLDLLVHNAGALGPSPLPAVTDVEPAALLALVAVNVAAPIALTGLLLPALRSADAPTVVAITSDAAVTPYAGWGAYGASKAALEQAVAVLGVEQPWLAVHRLDPGDLRTAMHQAAFPGEDIGDRPLPAVAAPAVLALLTAGPRTGRWEAAALLEEVSA